MLPLVIGGLVIATVVWVLSDNEDEKKTKKPSSSSSHPKTILEQNFLQLKKDLNKFKTEKKVVILGQPGAGKSSLLLKLTDNLCEPKPIVGQQTDATNWHNLKNNNFFHIYENFIYVDTPGYDTSTHPIKSYIEHFPFSSFDIIIFVTSGKIHDSDQKIMSKIKKLNNISSSTKLIMVRNFNENLNDKDKEDIEIDMEQIFKNKSEKLDFVFSSNKTDEGIDKIKDLINA